MKLTALKKFFKRDFSGQSRQFLLLQKSLEERGKVLSQEFKSRQKETVDWLEDRGVKPEEVWHRGTRGMLASVATGLIILSSGLAPEASNQASVQSDTVLPANKIVAQVGAQEEISSQMVAALIGKLPSTNRPLTAEEEASIVTSVNQVTGLKVAADLDGHRLNTNYGRIGLEQHLPLYPGDTINTHFTSTTGKDAYGKSGLTKNRGAFGYFAPNKYAVTPQVIEEEKYYVVVQTFLIPGWNKNMAEWYKHRKVMIVNPVNGKVVIGDIADSGPAKSTGKSFGGSPELMDSLGTYYGNSKTPVLMFFVDDTGGSPTLGPL